MEWPIIVEILVLIAVLFLPPAVVLGMISPIVVKLAVEARTCWKYRRADLRCWYCRQHPGYLRHRFLAHRMVRDARRCPLRGNPAFGRWSGLAGPRAELRDATLAALVLLAPIGAVRAGWTRSQCLRETPYHLTTKEFNERVRAWLKGDDLYVVNIIHGALGRFLRAYVRTLQQTFEYVYVIPRPCRLAFSLPRHLCDCRLQPAALGGSISTGVRVCQEGCWVRRW